MMLGSGAEVDAKDAEGKTAFMIAAGSGKMRLAQMLLAKGAQINVRDHRGWTPLMDAVTHAGMGSVTLDHIKFLIANKADVNARAKDGTSVLICAQRNATMTGSSETVNLLKKAGAKE